MTPAFLSPLIMQDDSGLPYTLVEPLLYRSERANALIEVPRGFRTDLASIPRGLWNVIPKSASYDRAAVVHDFLYTTGKVLDKPIDRGDADAVLREAMEACGVGSKTRFTIYWAVRMGGWKPWRSYRSKDK